MRAAHPASSPEHPSRPPLPLRGGQGSTAEGRARLEAPMVDRSRGNKLVRKLRPGLLNPRQILNHLPAQDDWYSIANKTSPDVVDVYLYDEIGSLGTTAADFMAELSEIKTAQIVVHISSQGGNVFDGIAIYNALRTHSSPVTTKVDALAASIASVIVQAGDRRMMVTGSQMMIHEACGMPPKQIASDMRDYADLLLDKLTHNIAGIYAERSGGTKAHFLSLMRAETWMSPGEAVSEGLADEVIKPARAETQENNADWDAFLASCEIDGGRVSRPSKVDWDKFLASIEIEE